jgi:uncharacterized protein
MSGASKAKRAELRYLPVDLAEVRVETRGGKPVLVGVAVPYGKLSVDLGGFRERFRPGSFARCLSAGADVRALVNHNRDLILGRNVAGTLRLADGEDALRYEIDPPDSAIAAHYVSAVERGDISGASFRFYCLTEEWGREGGEVVRDVVEAEIDDVSIVTYPAYPDTTAAMRSFEAMRHGVLSRHALRRLELAERE